MTSSILKFIWFMTTIASIFGQNSQNCFDCGLVVDTDIGGDDAMAVAMLIQKQKFEGPSEWGPLIALTTTNGNTGAINATRNAYILLDALQTQIPVIQGGNDALTGYIEPTYFYGYDGFGDFLPSVQDKKPNVPFRAASFIANIVNTNPGKITLLFIGPLTNLALALHMNPLLVKQSRRIVILGGVYQGVGNVPGHPGAEANIFTDPDAASFFFKQYSTPDKVILIPNEAVKTAPYTMPFRMSKLGGINGKLMNLLNKGERVGNINAGKTWLAYDQTAAAFLLDPRVAAGSVLGRVIVATDGPRGAMLADLNVTNSNVNIITKVNQNILTNLLFKYLQS